VNLLPFARAFDHPQTGKIQIDLTVELAAIAFAQIEFHNR
jgi:hypothetical protein